jgi:hypothetical protein
MLGLRCDNLRRLYPVHEKFSLCEIPDTIDLREPVKIADGSDHETTLTSMYRYMVRQAIADTRRFSAIQYDRALAVEVSCGLVLVEVIEDGCECIAALEFLGWNIALGVHVHNETRVFGE